MGVTVPKGAPCYLDAVAIIALVERIHPYWQKFEPLWQQLTAFANPILTSELTLLEVLVGPLKKGNAAVALEYEKLMTQTDIRLIPSSLDVYKQAAQLRASLGLKTADAIHAASALMTGCKAFITDDADFKLVPGLPLVMLSEL